MYKSLCILVLAGLAAGVVWGEDRIIFGDDFEQYPAGPIGDPWEPWIGPEGGAAVVTAEAASPFGEGAQGLRLSSGGRVRQLGSVWRHFPAVDNGTLILEFDFRVDNRESGMGASLLAIVPRADGAAQWLTSTGLRLGDTYERTPGMITTTAGDHSRIAVCELEPDTWHRLRQVWETGSDVLDLYLTRQGGQEQAFLRVHSGRGGHPYVDRLLLGAGWYGVLGNLDLDNVRLTHIPGAPALRPETRGALIPAADTAPARFAEALEARDAVTDGEASRRGFWVTAVDSLTEVFPDTFYPQGTEQGHELAAARGEAEALQVVLTAARDLEEVRVEVGPWRGPGGAVLPAEQNEAWLVGYELSRRTSPRAPGREWWPEFLLPFSEFSVPAGQSRSVWITVSVPREAPAGEYETEVRFSESEGQTAALPLRLRVYSFALPERPSLETDFWFQVPAPREGESFFDPRDLGQYEEQCRFLERYRVSSAPYGTGLLPDFVSITRLGPEEYSFDFSRLDGYLEIAFRYGTTGWNVNFSCNSGLMTYLGGHDGEVTARDAETGEEIVVIPNAREEMRAHRSREERHWYNAAQLERPVVRQFWQAYGAHLRERGWLEAAHFEVMDETPCSESYLAVHAGLHELVPDLRLMSFAASPVSHPCAVGVNGLWAPELSKLDREGAAMLERKEHGDKAWTYVCGAQVTSSRGHSADVYMCDPPLDRRMMGWFCWKYDLDGFLFYTLNSWGGWRVPVARDPEEFAFPVLPMRFWHEDWESVRGGEFGGIMYPWQREDGSWRLIPSVRLESLRDGLEDFEYFRLLRELAPDHPLLDVPGEMLVDVVEWTKSPRVLLSYREQLARAIEEHLAAGGVLPAENR